MLKQLMSNPALMNNFIEQLQKANIPLAALHQLLVQKKLIAPNQPLFPGHVITGASTSTAQSSHPTPPAHASPAAPAHATAPAQQTPTHPPSHHQTSAQSAIATSTTAPKPEEAPFGSFQYRKKLPKVPKKINADRATQLTLDLQSVLPDSEVLYRLVTFERQVDIFLRKRQLAMQEALPDQAQRKNTFPKTLRICVSNTCDNQPSGYHLDASQSSSLKELPSWTLKIEGRLVDSKTGVPEVAGKHGPVRKFSSFFKRIVIEFDKEQMAPDTNWFVEWNKAGVHDDVDGLEITRKGSREMAVNIGMYLDTERFSIGKDLASVLNLSHNQSYTKTAIILQLWSYVRSKGLQDSEARGHIKFDAPLRAVFAVDGAPYNDIPKLLHKHMHASDPIQIPFFLKYDVSFPCFWLLPDILTPSSLFLGCAVT
jgi:chromatin remodeling complex protein RSC6